MELRNNVDMAIIVGCFVAQIFVRGHARGAPRLGVVRPDPPGQQRRRLAGRGDGHRRNHRCDLRRDADRHAAPGQTIRCSPSFCGASRSPSSACSPTRSSPSARCSTIGIGNAILDVAGFTLIQRLGVDRTLGRVFGVLYTFGIAMGGLGSLAAPALISWLGLRTVLVGVGLVLPVLALGAAVEVPIDRRSLRTVARSSRAADATYRCCRRCHRPHSRSWRHVRRQA